MRPSAYVFALAVMLLKGLALAFLVCLVCRPARARRMLGAGWQGMGRTVTALRRGITRLRRYPDR